MRANNVKRIKLYETHLGEIDQLFKDTEPDPDPDSAAPAIDVLAFERDFSTDDDEKDLGWVLITSGMSDRRMTLDAEAEREAKEDPSLRWRAELVWYVREPKPEHLAHLRWLAKFPFIDSTWLGFGHTIPLPEPIFRGSRLTTSLLLTPIIEPEQDIAEALTIDGDAVELLVVHLLTNDEHRLKQESGVDSILDLFDDNEYPLVLNERRLSLVEPKK